MHPQPTFSTSKIIALIVMITIALIGTLFVLHGKTSPAKISLASGEGTLFPVGRDIKAFEFKTSGETKFTEKSLKQHWTVLFFGFTHCSTICPATFEMLKQAYPSLKKEIPSFQVVLASLDPERDTAELVSKYAHGFHSDFIGITGDIQQLRKLQAQLGIYAARAPSENLNDNNYQIEHSSSLLLINPKGQWVGIYPIGLSSAQFASIILKSIKLLT